MIKIGQIITLDNYVEYAVVEKVEVDNKELFILMTIEEPITIKVCTNDGENNITLIENPEIIKDALLHLI